MTKTERRGYKQLMEALRQKLGEEEFLRDVGENVSTKTVVEVIGSEKIAEELDPKVLGIKRIIEMARAVKPDITAAEIEKLIREGTEGGEKAEK